MNRGTGFTGVLLARTTRSQEQLQPTLAAEGGPLDLLSKEVERRKVTSDRCLRELDEANQAWLCASRAEAKVRCRLETAQATGRSMASCSFIPHPLDGLLLPEPLVSLQMSGQAAVYPCQYRGEPAVLKVYAKSAANACKTECEALQYVPSLPKVVCG